MTIFFMASIIAEEPSTGAKKTKKYNLSMCAFFKNEAKSLKEWLEYHLVVGVDHFYLYNNGSYDQFREILNPYIKRGVVTLIYWPDLIEAQKKDKTWMWVLSTLISAYENAIKIRTANETKWLVFADVNEFLVPIEAKKLSEVLEKYGRYPGIIIPMDFFDASKDDTLPRRKLLIETAELVGAQLNPEWEVAKMIFKPDQCKGFTWPPYKCWFKNEQEAIKLDRKELRINRYLNRFKGCLDSGKLREKLQVDNRILSEEELSGLLEEGYEIKDQDCAIHRFIPKLLKKLGYEK